MTIFSGLLRPATATVFQDKFFQFELSFLFPYKNKQILKWDLGFKEQINNKRG